jgi:site-specific DNA-methyltransferase (adenine-specific)
MTNQKVHLTEKPVGLLMDLLKVVPPGGSVLDPFAGSSSTGEAALRLGLHYVGIESTPAYHDIAVNRLQRVEGELKAPGQVQINLIQKGLCLTA